MGAATDPRTNHLLAAPPEREWQCWLPHLESIDLPLGRARHEAGVALAHACFPTSAIVSLPQMVADGSAAEIAEVGIEGIVGVAPFTGAETTAPRREAAQGAGRVHRLPAQASNVAFDRLPAVMRKEHVRLLPDRVAN